MKNQEAIIKMEDVNIVYPSPQWSYSHTWKKQNGIIS